ncbi:hypothetical protein NDN11_16720 [Acinetobacter sp. C26M]|uniref:hypothetical protein n=1 Tax=unclassified Acinetobacter TaxID=196816 RepID=UPI002036F1A2|nr:MULTISPECIES: hypothetical protein [unclassified Acinetobacter]USA46309.1 hypothetical protein NDN11_16720 [Acinetobacter sp. C26M]USA49793.1 hypothetical protein NDN12_16635 [Acinetobacter sp. C26G]
MRKIGYLILGLSLLWLAKLSYDVAQYSQTVPQLQQQLDQTEQRYALLNDQFVAVQRQLQNTSPVEPTDSVAIPTTLTGIAPVILIKQQMQLVQFALDQQQFIYALDQLNQVQQHVVQYAVSPALQHSLVKSIEQDKQIIQQYVLSQTQQQQQLDNLLQQLDQKIQQEIRNPKVSMTNNEAASWWQWFKLEKVQRNSPDLMNRNITLKEAQLRLLLASQALKQGQLTEYRKSILEVMQLVAELPDQNSQQMKLRLEKILNLPAVPTPKLTTLGLLG